MQKLATKVRYRTFMNIRNVSSSKITEHLEPDKTKNKQQKHKTSKNEPKAHIKVEDRTATRAA